MKYFVKKKFFSTDILISELIKNFLFFCFFLNFAFNMVMLSAFLSCLAW